MDRLIPGGTSGPAGIKAGIGATHPVSGSAFSLPETKPELAGIRNLTFCLKNLANYWQVTLEN